MLLSVPARRARRLLLLTLTASALWAALPAGASAQSYCVNDLACVRAGGTQMATIEAAATAAAGDVASDVLRIGASATPYQLSSTVVIPAGRTLDIYGAGAASTKIVGPTGQAAFVVMDGDTQIGLVDISGTRNGDTIVNFTDGTTSFSNVLSATISNAGTTPGTSAVKFATSGTVTKSTISTPLTTSGGYGIDWYPTATESLGIRDTSITAATPVYLFDGQGDVSIQRSTLTYSFSGIRLYSHNAPATLDVDVASSLIKHDGTLGGFTSAISAEAGDSGGAITNTVTVRNSTIAHPSPSVAGIDRALVGAALGGGTGSTSNNFTLDGVIVHGPFTHTLALSDAVDGGGINYDSTATISRSNIDTSPAKLSLANVPGPTLTANTNVDPRFVDAANADYHLRYDSPLLDTGLTTLDPGEGTTDLDSRTRLAHKTAAPAAVPALDIGAYEYNRMPPVINGATPSGTVTPGSAVTYAIDAFDRNAGETAALTYAWALPGGASATTPTVTFTTPTTPGTYAVSVVVTDLSGATASASTQLVVPAAGAPPTLPPPLLADVTKPKARLVATPTKLTKLLKRTAVRVRLTPTEAVSAKLTLAAKVTTPAKRRAAKPTTSTVKLGTLTAPVAAGARTLQLAPSKAGANALAAKLRTRGAKATYTIAGTVTDAAGNTTSVTTTLKVTA